MNRQRTKGTKTNLQLLIKRKLKHARIGACYHCLAGLQSEAALAKKIGEPNYRREDTAIRVPAFMINRGLTGDSQTDGEFGRKIVRRRAINELHAWPDDKPSIEQTIRQQFWKR